MRSFVAITLPENTLDALIRIQARLPVGPFVARSNLHLTLAFLDDQPVETLELLNDELEMLKVAVFPVRLSGLGCFGGDRPRLVFAEAVLDGALEHLHRQVVKAARRVGVQLQLRRFHPHVTLARPKPGFRGAELLQRFIASESHTFQAEFPVNSISLFRSDLHPAGAIHTELARYELA